MTFPGFDTFPGWLTFPGVLGLSWPPPGWVDVTVARVPRVMVSTASKGSVPAVMPWRPRVPVSLGFPFSVAVAAAASMNVRVDIPYPFDVSYVADATGGTVNIGAGIEFEFRPSASTAPAVADAVAAAFEVSVAAVVASWSITDTFDRANGAIGSSWNSSTLAPVVNGNKAQAGTAGSNNATNLHIAHNVNRLGKTNHEVEFTLATPTGTAGLDGGVTAILRSNGDTVTQTYVEIGVTGTVAFINTFVAGTGAQKASVASQSFTSGQVLVARVVGNKYSLWRTGVELLSWTDSGNAFPVSAENDRFGFRVSNTKNFSGSSVSYGFAVDSLTARTL